MKRPRTGLLALVLGLGSAHCSVARPPTLESCEAGLRVTVHTTAPAATVGDAFDVIYTLTNTGSAPLLACFGPSFEVVFSNGVIAKGWAEVVGHPSCMQEFSLQPGAQATRAYRAKVPEVSEGLFSLHSKVQIVDPDTCDKYGCDRSMLSSSNRPTMAVSTK